MNIKINIKFPILSNAIRFALFTLFFAFSFLLKAQQQITLKSAIDSALKNNFDIQIAKNIVEINKVSNTFGMAGGMPSITITGSDNNSLSGIVQKLSSGAEINKSNVSGNSLNSGLAISMPLFNGFKIIATKERLDLLQKQSELMLNQQIQNTLAAVMVKYFDIVRQQSYLKITQSSLEVSKKKLDVINERYNVGMANDADVLQAQIDVNSAEQNVATQEIIIEQGKTDLLQILSVKKFFPISISDTMLIDNKIQIDSIINYLNKNPQYLSAEQQIKINEQVVKEINSQRFPTIKVNTGYNLSSVQSSAGLTLLNQNYGPYAGLTLQIPIFNGNVFKVQRHVAKYNVNNAKLQSESLLNNLKTGAIKTFDSYKNILQQLIAQQTNYKMSEKLVDIIMQKFQLNQATIIDVKTAQSSYENVGYLLINLQYAAKTAEIELKRLTYNLSY